MQSLRIVARLRTAVEMLGVAALLSVIRAQSSSVQLPQDIADKFGAKCLDGSAPKCACMRAKHRTT